MTKDNKTKSASPELKKAASKRDVVAESKSGTMRTDSGAEVDPVSPAIPHGAEYAAPELDEAFTKDEQLAFVGDLEPGTKCYLPTDAAGNVKGPAVENIDEAGEWFVPVFVDSEGDHLLTPAGAPITKRMNPDTRKEAGDNDEIRSRTQGTRNTVDT